MDHSSQKSPLAPRYWGDETGAGGVWGIYLKKVRYHPSSSYTNGENDDGVSHLEWETIKIKSLKAGNLDVIVASLADDQGELDPNVPHIVLSTFRSFATTRQLLDSIIRRYTDIKESRIKIAEDGDQRGHLSALIQTLTEWIDKYPEDFFAPPDHEDLLELQRFVGMWAPSSAVERRIQSRLKEFRAKKSTRFFEPKSWINEYSRDQMKIALQFEDIDNKHFALQLTWMDMTLFKRLVPYHCLAHRMKKDERYGETYNDTVKQFNSVVRKVISMIVMGGAEVKVTQRAEVLTKWIEIADELRYVKNFTSLKAIIAALQSNDIYRLSRVWQAVAKEKAQRFSELAAIFSEENNEMNARSLLLREGTAKTADWKPDRANSKSPKNNKTHHFNHQPTISGTIPYLGTFTKDLTMTDTALPETTKHPDGSVLINFEKKRREFEILANIKILQGSANSYSIQPDPAFLVWFDSIETLREDESYELSCEIEPPNPVTIKETNSRTEGLRRSTSVNDAVAFGHRKNPSTSSTSSSSCALYSQDLQSNSDVSSMQSLAVGVADSSGLGSLSDSRLSQSTCSLSLTRNGLSTNGRLVGSPGARNPEVHIAKVSVAQPGVTPLQGQNLYKSIFLSNRERTQQVIKVSLEKFSITDDPGNYILAQQGPDGQEIIIPPDTNVFYAVNKSFDLNFVLKHRSLQRPTGPSLLKHKSSSMSLLLRRKF